MSIKILFFTLILSIITISSSLEILTKLQPLHLKSIQQSHDQSKINKEYTFTYQPKVDPKTYMGDFTPSPRIMKYLPLMNKDGQIEPYNTNIEQVKKLYLANLKYNKTVDKQKVNELTTFFTTEMGRTILTYFQDLARGGLNFYSMTDPHFRQWLAIKIIAGKDIKMYARSMTDDIELFKQFYINSMNKKVKQYHGIPEPPKSPIKYIPPPTNNPNTQEPSIVKNIQKPNLTTPPKSTGNNKPLVNTLVKPYSPTSKLDISNRKNSQNLNPSLKLNTQTPLPNKVQKNVKPTNKYQDNKVQDKQTLPTQTTILPNKDSPKFSQVNNKQQSNSSTKNVKNTMKNTQDSSIIKSTKQHPSLLLKKEVTTTVDTKKIVTTKPRIAITVQNQNKILNKLDNRQLIKAKEVKQSIRTVKKQQPKTTKITDNKQALVNPALKSVLEIIPESKIQIQTLFQDGKHNQI